MGRGVTGRGVFLVFARRYTTICLSWQKGGRSLHHWSTRDEKNRDWDEWHKGVARWPANGRGAEGAGWGLESDHWWQLVSGNKSLPVLNYSSQQLWNNWTLAFNDCLSTVTAPPTLLLVYVSVQEVVREAGLCQENKTHVIQFPWQSINKREPATQLSLSFELALSCLTGI